tara:strand:+ start:110730 stop:110954 length:225 start_codon:yes stop_codon:yes gene_type:complete
LEKFRSGFAKYRLPLRRFGEVLPSHDFGSARMRAVSRLGVLPRAYAGGHIRCELKRSASPIHYESSEHNLTYLA